MAEGYKANITLKDKQDFLAVHSEDSFRDECVRPLLEKLGYTFLRNSHGTQEEGKDSIYSRTNNLGFNCLVAVQTKKGDLTMAGTAGPSNVVTAANQMATCLATKIADGTSKSRSYPEEAILVASGKINEPAHKFISEEVKDARLKILDNGWLIQHIDLLMPEYWQGINPVLIPYLTGLKDKLLSATDVVSPPSSSDGAFYSPLEDSVYAPLFLSRITFKPVTFTAREKILSAPGQPIIPKTTHDVQPEFQEIKAEAILKTNERLFLILGDGGSGKTTALRKIALTLIDKAVSCQDDVCIPILLRARQLFAGSVSLTEAINDSCRECTHSSMQPYTVGDLSAGRLVILIDGLEEVGTDQAVEKVLERIAEFSGTYNKTRFIVTSREYGFLRRISGFSSFVHFRVCPLSILAASRILSVRCRDDSKAIANSQEILRRLQDVHGLSLTPMLVTVFAASTDFHKRDIPPNITEIFKKYTELMLGRWDEKRGLEQQFEPGLKDFLLRGLAFHMHSQRISSLPFEEVRVFISKELSDRGLTDKSMEIVNELVFESNLLLAIDDQVAFRHPLLREFFAGRNIEGVVQLCKLVQEDWWRRAVVFYFGDHPGEISSLLQVCEACDHLPDSLQFEAAVTLGLAIQTCYLAKTEDKVNALDRVILALSFALKQYVAEAKADGKGFVLPFIYSYLLGRDSVACNNVNLVAKKYVSEKRPKAPVQDYDALPAFWCTVGLMEAGYSSEAYDAIESFFPEDTLLLVALHMGCFSIANLKISTDSEKYFARKGLGFLQEKVLPYRDAILSEFKSQLLELRDGKVVAIESEKAQAE